MPLKLPLRYGEWHITHSVKPIPWRCFDYEFYHDGFDGAPDSGDTRCGSGMSVQDCLNQIDQIVQEIEDERA